MHPRRALLRILALAAFCLTTGCAHRSRSSPQANSHLSPLAFSPARDGLAYPNETKWIYQTDPATGRQISHPRSPPPSYALHCFVSARVVKQFHLHATFRPDRPKSPPSTLSQQISSILARSPRTVSSQNERVVIDGYSGLFELSRDHETLLKQQAGGAWQSYLQRGHWRMILPFSKSNQRRLAENLQTSIDSGNVALLHIVRFPQLTINHAIVVGRQLPSDDPNLLIFGAYDPNLPGQEIPVTFDRRTSRFQLPPLPYFSGGHVNAYEIFSRPWN